MNALPDSLPHRILSAAIALIPLVDTGISYAEDGDNWRLLSMLGWVVMGVAWFLRPAFFSRSIEESNRRSEKIALITHKQWAGLVFFSLLIVSVALVARYVGAA